VATDGGLMLLLDSEAISLRKPRVATVDPGDLRPLAAYAQHVDVVDLDE
jgi:hypothetical protein